MSGGVPVSSRIPVLLAWSGGKAAAWALPLLRQSATHQVVGLLSTVAAGRASMQGVRVEILRAQADATGLPLLEMEVAPGCDNASYLHALAASLDQAASRWPGLRTAAFGDLLLEDLRAWRREQLDSLDWALLTPLFRFDTAMLARRMVDSGVRASLCCVDTRRLDAGFVGRTFDADLLDALPPGVDRCGENGEFHTCVWDGPMFTTPLALEPAGTTLDPDGFAHTDFRLAR